MPVESDCGDGETDERKAAAKEQTETLGLLGDGYDVLGSIV